MERARQNESALLWLECQELRRMWLEGTRLGEVVQSGLTAWVQMPPLLLPGCVV